MKPVIQKSVEYCGRFFHVMLSGSRVRVWEIQASTKKFSAQLTEVKPPERDVIAQHFTR